MIKAISIDTILEAAAADSEGYYSSWVTPDGDHELTLDQLGVSLHAGAVTGDGEWSYLNKIIYYRAPFAAEFRERWLLNT